VTVDDNAPASGPLVGLKVLEMGSLIAGPFCGRLLADFGATVIKLEPPSGDPLRTWSLVTEHGSLWSLVQGRNKHCVTADLRTSEGRELARSLAAECDVLIENFRPGRMEEWGMGFEELEAINPGLVMVRISGYGQTGPSAHKPGFGNIAESVGGIRYITGWPDRPPLRVGLSLADSVAALYAMIGTMMALHERQRSGRGQVVDVALTESVFSLLEAILPEFGFDGRQRDRSGNTLNGAAPSNVYQTKDDRWLAIGANGDSIFARLADAIAMPELATDPRFATNQGRRQHHDELDAIIAGWVREHTAKEAQDALDAQLVPAGSVHSIADIVADRQFKARDMIVEVAHEGLGRVLMPGVVPRLTRTPGSIRWPGPEVGSHDSMVTDSGFAAGGSNAAADQGTGSAGALDGDVDTEGSVDSRTDGGVHADIDGDTDGRVDTPRSAHIVDESEPMRSSTRNS
jgi:crotonobetainyl-CoA:carnitine CoA-transferase CaiB-like acyl-CoA transferase